MCSVELVCSDCYNRVRGTILVVTICVWILDGVLKTLQFRIVTLSVGARLN
jgi:hypothetical protein